MLKAVSTMDSYGVVNDGAVQNNNGGNNNSGDQPSGGLIPDMHLAFTTEDGAAVYKPVMPPNSPLSAASGIGGDGSALPKRQRGRPKKYPYEVDMSSLPPQPLEASAGYRASGLASPPPTTTKSRGRPVGSGLKQQPQAIMGSPRGELTTHVITVTAGEDVSSKIMSFSENGNRGVWILSANGAISNVTLHKPATSEETVTYQGHFEILSLSGSYMLLEEGGQRSRTCGLTVTLAGPDGCVLGGGVAGILTAAAPVQVVVGCFIAREVALNSPIQADPLATPPKLLPGASSSETLSESSGGPGSPIDQSPGACKH